MATVGNIQRDYFGVTLYVTPRGRDLAFACRADKWEPKGKGLVVWVRTWPGYGHYSGKVRLNEEQTARFFEAQKAVV